MKESVEHMMMDTGVPDLTVEMPRRSYCSLFPTSGVSTGDHLTIWRTKEVKFHVQIERQATIARYVPNWSCLEEPRGWKHTISTTHPPSSSLFITDVKQQDASLWERLLLLGSFSRKPIFFLGFEMLTNNGKGAVYSFLP